jgi:ribosomal protein L37AE/L43A
MEMYDSLISYQVNLVNPLKKEPFCLTCGEDLEEKYVEGTWKCEKCRKDKFAKMLKKQKEIHSQSD